MDTEETRKLVEDLLLIARPHVREEYPPAFVGGFLCILNAQGGTDLVLKAGDVSQDRVDLQTIARETARTLYTLGDRLSSHNAKSEQNYHPGAFRATNDWIYSFFGLPGPYWNEAIAIMLAYQQGHATLRDIFSEVQSETVERLDKLMAHFVKLP